MKSNLEKILTEVEEAISLRRSERERLWQSISSSLEKRDGHLGIGHPHLSGFKPRLRITIFTRVTTLASVCLILIGGSLSVVAESALPGDFLYPLKTGFTEEVRGWIKFSSQREAEWESKRAERRLLEAEKLAIRGRLNKEVAAEVEENFSKHTERFVERVDVLRKDKPRTAAALEQRFWTALDAHSEVLGKLSRKSDEAARIADTVALRAAPKISAVAPYVAARSDALREPKDEDNLESAERSLESARRSIERRLKEVGADKLIDAEAEITAAEEKFTAGKEKIESGSLTEAYLFFRDAERIAQKVVKQLEIEAELNLKDITDAEPPIEIEPELNDIDRELIELEREVDI